MAMATKAKRKTRRKLSPLGKLEHSLGMLRDLRRQGRYSVLGEVRLIRILREDGPKLIDLQDTHSLWVAFADGTKQLLVLSDWLGLPKTEPSNEFCGDCLAPCTVCNETGKKVCELCGGCGETAAPMVPCPGVDCAAAGLAPNPACASCRGSGSFTPKKKCEMCHGTKVMTCSSCRGTRKRPSGLEGGSREYDNPKIQKCSSCRGKCFAPKAIEHDLAAYRNGTLGPYSAIGPVVAFSVQPPGERNQLRDWAKVEPDGEQHMMLLVNDKTCEAFFLGGLVVHSN